MHEILKKNQKYKKSRIIVDQTGTPNIKSFLRAEIFVLPIPLKKNIIKSWKNLHHSPTHFPFPLMLHDDQRLPTLETRSSLSTKRSVFGEEMSAVSIGFRSIRSRVPAGPVFRRVPGLHILRVRWIERPEDTSILDNSCPTLHVMENGFVAPWFLD